MEKFKELNQFEYLGLVNILKEAFPFIDDMTCGTCNDNLINLQNTYTENHPNDKFCYLGAFGLSEGHDIILEFWDDKDESKYYYITFRDARDYSSSEYEPYNLYLKNYN